MKTKTNFKTTTLYSSHSTNRSPPLTRAFTESKQEFKLVHLPPSADIMNICTMNIRENKTANPTMSPREEEGEEVEREARGNSSPLKSYLRKGKSMSTLTGINFKGGKTSSSLSKLLAQASEKDSQSISSKTSIKLKIQKSQHLLQSKINMNELYTQIIMALALINGGVLLTGESKAFHRVRRGRVDRGNNGYIVKQTAKKRTWWNITD